MKKINAMSIALENLIEEEAAVIETPAAPEVSEEEVAQGSELVEEVVGESQDIDSDVEQLVSASTGLESLAEAMLEEGYDEAGEGDVLSSVEAAGVSPALEAVGDAPVNAGEGKKSVYERVKEGGKKVLEWLAGVLRKIADWIVETFQKVFTPLNTYAARLKGLVGTELDESMEIPERLGARLAGVATAADAINGYVGILKSVTTVGAGQKAKEAVELLKADSNPEAVRKVFVDLRQKYTTIYNQKLDDGWTATKVFAGGVRFTMKATENSFDHKVEHDKNVPSRIALIKSGDLSALATGAGALYAAIKAASDKDGAPSMIKSIGSRISTMVGSNKELSAEAKALVHVIPKLLKSPSIDMALQAAGTLGAVVKLAELQAKSAKKDAKKEAKEAK